MGSKPRSTYLLEKKSDAANTVVLIHGLASHRLLLKPLEAHLKRCGYHTINWGYWSILSGIQQHAEQFGRRLTELERSPDVEQIHLVTHSMGGIVARQVLSANRFRKIRDIVMLGPPNHGSRVAAFLARGLGWFCKPLSELSHEEDSLVNQLAPPRDIDVGVIAATFDRVVAVESTHLATEQDHRVVPYGHNSMLFRREVAQLVSTFLREGTFTEQPKPLAGAACA